MDQAVKLKKPAIKASDVATPVFDKAIQQALKIANAPDIDYEAAEKDIRTKTPFSVLYSLRYQRTTRQYKGGVNGNGVPHLTPKAAADSLSQLGTHLFNANCREDFLRARAAGSDFKDAVLHEADVAITTETCSSCGGNGTFRCTPCGTSGVERCHSCMFSGWVNCSSCGGRGGFPGDRGSPGIPCMYCTGKGRVYCHACNGTVQVACRSCGGKGCLGCNGCASTGILSTVHGGKFTLTAKFSMGKSTLSPRQASLLNLWVQGGFRDMGTPDDPVAPWSNVASAPVTRIGEARDYRVDFDCHATLTRIDFLHEGEKAWAEYVHLPLSSPVFSPFLDGAVIRAGEVSSDADSPSKALKALEGAGFGRIAGYLKENPDEVAEKASTASYGALSGKTLAYLVSDYKDKSARFARGAMLRAWKFPTVVALAGWAAASHFGVLDAARENGTIYPLAGLALAAAAVAVSASSVEARWAIITETGSARGWKIGPAAVLCAIASAALFSTTAFYGINM